MIVALEYSARCGNPQDRDDVAGMVKTFLDTLGRKTPFDNNCPGKDWMTTFVCRHKDTLRPRKPELLTKARSDGLSEHVVTMFYSLLEEEIREKNIAPESIYILNETGLNTDPQAKKVFVPRSSRDAYLKSATCGKAMYSVMFCVSATGNYLPPFVVYKGLHLYNTWTSGGPPGCVFATIPSGWMQDKVFESWFRDFFIQPTLSNQRPILLIYDGHRSHLTYNTVMLAIQNDISIICLPPNCSHALQPLNVGVFKNLKVEWKFSSDGSESPDF